MHAIFIAYGMRDKVEFFLGELEHLKLPLTARKDGKEVKTPVQCSLRILPGGFYDFVFPREHMAALLTALKFHEKSFYNIDKEYGLFGFKVCPLKELRKFLHLEPEIPEFKTDNKIALFTDWISIIPIGIKYDRNLTEESGWTHEAL